MVFRIYTEKKKPFDIEARALLRDIAEVLGISGATGLRLINRYDVEGISRELFDACVPTVFSEPQTDTTCEKLDISGAAFAAEYLPGQYDQRADSCAQCIQIASGGEKPAVRTARIYLISGDISDAELARIKQYVINPVESREAELKEFKTLREEHGEPEEVPVLHGFLDMDGESAKEYIAELGLAMDLPDLLFCRDYFAAEGRCPTLTELRLIDTYWSDHCRHTTFLTELSETEIEDGRVERAYGRYLENKAARGSKKPVTLMDIATAGAKDLKRAGKLTALDESEEINACTVNIEAEIDGAKEDYLLLFKNETHNHPTEIEPFGGAATCIGGAIRDPLSGRAYVYQAMRVTGAGDPTVPIGETLAGKLPQRKLTVTAAAGYSSYGNQIGLATGLVDELYHPGYVAKRMEIGAVVGAVKKKDVYRGEPMPGDVVVLLGGRTGRDGCGGATGSSKSHDATSLVKCGAEVQKGNAPEERKLQRLMRNPEASRMIIRCNDFGAGGVSVAVGELADGLAIELDALPKKYEGLSGTELAISESQERMAVVLSKGDLSRFLGLAAEENLEATVVARVTEQKRMTMDWRGERIVDLSREFLNSNGAKRSAAVRVEAASERAEALPGSIAEGLAALAGDINVASKRGLAERFDSTIGAATVLMPFGGKYQRTPAQVMAAKLPVMGETDDCSVMAYGADVENAQYDPYAAGYMAVAQSAAKLAAAGADLSKCWLTFQEYFPRLREDARRWGLPFSALLGAYDAQLDLSLAAIGGKDSMSGSFAELDVPPTLVSFAVSASKASALISPEFKRAGDAVSFIEIEMKDGVPDKESFLAACERVAELISSKSAVAVWATGRRGIAEGLIKMSLGNRLGVELSADTDVKKLFSPRFGFIVEGRELCGEAVGRVSEAYAIGGADMALIERIYDERLERVFPVKAKAPVNEAVTYTCERRCSAAPRVSVARPRVLIPVFPGTNCEYDSERAFVRAGAEVNVFVINNLTAAGLSDSVRRFALELARSQIVFIPGGFSGGDEPDGSGKFITAFFRNPEIAEGTEELLYARDGLMGGICNGFQALIKLGLLPGGHICRMEDSSPTLTFNTIGRHQSRLYRTRIASAASPWLNGCSAGDIHTVAISHGEGRFVCSAETLAELAAAGQIATQYVDHDGNASMDIEHNPNGSMGAVEGLISPDGRIIGKMGHSERIGRELYKNVPGSYDNRMFVSAVGYFR